MLLQVVDILLTRYKLQYVTQHHDLISVLIAMHMHCTARAMFVLYASAAAAKRLR
jgi:hypothetical protein